MKECEKFIESLPFHYQGGGFISIEEIGIRRGWKAALEWILYAGVLTDLPKDLIEEELGRLK